MLRKIVCQSRAPALGIMLVALIMLAFSTASAAAAPLGPSGPHVGTVDPALVANPSPHSQRNATAVRPAINPLSALPAAPAGGIGLSVNYAHDWVCTYGGLPEGQIQITAKRGGSVLATLNGSNHPDGTYCSYEQNDWAPQQPDLQVGDSVTVTANGVTAAVDRVGEIAGTLNVATGTVSGNLHVPALAPNALDVVCEVWVQNNNVSPIVRHSVAANGGAYTCNFGAKGFHMAPGDDIAVRYFEPDGDQVINVFHAPAPDLSIDMWNEGPAVAGAGGLALFHILYQNNGGAPAADVLLTDNLAAHVTFVQGTLVQGTTPVLPVVTPGQVVWHLGTLAPGQVGHFFVILANTLDAGTTLENSVAIATSSPGDNLNDNQRSVSIPVNSGAPDVNVDQGVNPGDPLPGDSYRIEINYGNNGSVPAGPVTIHLQLAPGTALQSWFSSNHYDQLWTLTANTGSELTFVAPALPAGFGDQLEVRAGIASSVGPKVQLSSTARIETPGDANPGNNGPVTRDAWTNTEPRPDLSVNKQWGYGMLAPGGVAWYQINYGNDGTLTQASVRLTDTLPAGTSFVEATVDSNWGFSQLVPPTHQAGNVLTWDLGTLPAASWGNLKVKLALDGVTAGTTITNTARIGGVVRDRSWWNNSSDAVEHVNGAGANLRLRQTSWWDWPGQVRFELQFENAGTTVVNNVQITDTLPTGLDFNGQWWSNGGDLSCNYHAATRQIVCTIGQLQPTSSGGVGIRLDVPQADIGHQGLQYTNRAQITLPPGEVSPADNSVSTLAFSGPDLFINQSLQSGKAVPGAVVTFVVDFGNHNNGPWGTGQPAPDSPGVLITDTLPAGMIFISATDPWSPGNNWDPQPLPGNKLVWGVGDVCSNCRYEFLVTARIADTVKAGTVLTHGVEIGAIAPDDVDIFQANNTSSWSAKVWGSFYLPTLRR